MEGICKSKSDSSNSLQESEASGLGSSEQMIQLPRGTNPGFNKQVKVVPSISTSQWEYSNLLVSGPTKSTNTPVKSTESNSEIKNSLKVTSGRSQAQKYPTMTFSALASLVRVFPLRENVKVFKTSQGELFSLKSSESCEIKDQNTYSLRMLKDYFLTTQGEPSQLYCFHWMGLGMMRNGLSQTLSITYRKTGKGSLSSVLEKEVEEKYYLKEGMLKFLDKRQSENNGKRGGTHFSDGSDVAKCLDIGKTRDSSKTFIAQCGHRTRGKPRFYTDQIPAMAQDYGTGGQNIPLILGQKIRRLTPKECERLQGFPDGWTGAVSDTQRYKMMGNAVSVPVITAIGKKILQAIK